MSDHDGIAAAFALLDPTPAAEATASATGTEVTPDAPSPEVLDLQQQLDAARADNAALLDKNRRAELGGKVSDVDAALKLLDPEKHLREDGSINVNALQNEFPSLYVQQTTPNAPSGGGGPHSSGTPSLESALSRGDVAGTNYAFNYELNRK